MLSFKATVQFPLKMSLKHRKYNTFIRKGKDYSFCLSQLCYCLEITGLKPHLPLVEPPQFVVALLQLRRGLQKEIQAASSALQILRRLYYRQNESLSRLETEMGMTQWIVWQLQKEGMKEQGWNQNGCRVKLMPEDRTLL